VPGGLLVDVTGTGRTESAIRAMPIPHATELDQMPGLGAKTETIRGGVRLTVTAREAEDAKAIARVRGLGFIGLLTLGAHHQRHHLAMARGQAMPGHGALTRERHARAVVPGGGIEPPRPCGHQILSLARLPSSAIPAR
jgi:hypothetical protein